MKRVVSFSLWGTSAIYLQGALDAVGQVAHAYPGWECWFYLGKDVPETVRKQLADKGARVLDGAPWGPWAGMYWRFLAASDPEVEIMISRDVDTRILEREVTAVHEWLVSGKTLHIMRDHPKHEMPIMGGMWGCRTAGLRDMESLIRNHGKFERYGHDQEFLSRIIYPKFIGDCWIHSDSITFPPEYVHPFPTKRKDLNYIGSAQRDAELVDKHDLYLSRWIQRGSPIIKRPHPWSKIGRARFLVLAVIYKFKKLFTLLY